jgi:hypothetical protein
MSESVEDPAARLRRDIRQARWLLLVGIVSAALLVPLLFTLTDGVPAVVPLLIILLTITMAVSLVMAPVQYLVARWRLRRLSRLPPPLPTARVVQRDKRSSA